MIQGYLISLRGLAPGDLELGPTPILQSASLLQVISVRNLVSERAASVGLIRSPSLSSRDKFDEAIAQSSLELK